MLSFILQDSIMDIKSIRVSNYQKEKDDRVGKGIFILGAAGGVLEVMGRIWRGKWRIFEGLFDYK